MRLARGLLLYTPLGTSALARSSRILYGRRKCGEEMIPEAVTGKGGGCVPKLPGDCASRAPAFGWSFGQSLWVGLGFLFANKTAGSFGCRGWFFNFSNDVFVFF